MDLNTGTPIPQPSSQVPPMPGQSPGIPGTSVSQTVSPPSTIPPQASAVPLDDNLSTSVPEVSENPPTLPPLNETEKSDIVDTLADLQKMAESPDLLTTNEELADAPGGSLPEVITQPSEPTTSAPLLSGAVSPGIPTIDSSPAVTAVPSVSEVSGATTAVDNTAQTTPVSLDMPVVTSDALQPNATPVTPQPRANISMPGAYDTKTLLNLVVEKDASDLHLAVGYQPMIRIDGSLVTVGDTILDPKTAKELIYSILPDDKKEQLEVNREVDLAYQHEGAGRFRINAYWQRGYISAAFRLIPTRIRTIQELKLPDLFHKFSDMEQGLVLVTGPTGHGKSTTLAAVIQEINMKHPKHILTIEDPIEYVFPQQKALVSQRELGDDTHSWKGALRSALREDPDVVLVGEMRDLETISAAITVAETGHLVFATLHTNSAAQTIQRIVNMYPDVQQEEIRTELADVLEAVVAQRLIPIKGGGRRAALEIMLMTPAIRNLIRENKIYQIDNIIRTSVDIGMITLEKSLLGLYREGLIDQDDALRYALDATEMARLLEELV